MKQKQSSRRIPEVALTLKQVKSLTLVSFPARPGEGIPGRFAFQGE